MAFTPTNMLTLVFWALLFIVFYSYIGYGILLGFLVKLKKTAAPPTATMNAADLPEVTFMVAAYNEERWIEDKIRNSLALDYPKNKIHFFFVTDGSTDSTPDRVLNFPNTEGYTIELFHKPERRGKIAAVERVMPFVKTPVVVFTDANTDLNPEAVWKMVRHYADPTVGAIAGENAFKCRVLQVVQVKAFIGNTNRC